jgi:hypothetical protein
MNLAADPIWVSTLPVVSRRRCVAGAIKSGIAMWAVLLAGGCQHNPMGLSDEQWRSLPLEQKAEYQARQTEIDVQRRAREASEQLASARAVADSLRREQERLQTAYAQARYGDIVTVTVSGGMVAFQGKRSSYEPVAFDLIRGETKRVEFSRQGQSYAAAEIEMRLSEDGNTFVFDVPARRRFTALNDGSWATGARYAVPQLEGHESRSEAQGVKITIRLRETLPGAPRRRIY